MKPSESRNLKRPITLSVFPFGGLMGSCHTVLGALIRRRAVLILSLAAPLVTLTSCLTTGNESLRKQSEQSVAGLIVEGRTTRAEVKTRFGSPLTTDFTDGGLEIWRYDLNKMSRTPESFIPIVKWFAPEKRGVKKELVVAFDRRGIVHRYSMSESALTVRAGILNQ